MEELAERTLIIYNLIENFNETELKEKFESIGEIEEFKQYKDKNCFPFLPYSEFNNIVTFVFKEQENVESSFMYNESEFNGTKLQMHIPTAQQLEKIKEEFNAIKVIEQKTVIEKKVEQVIEKKVEYVIENQEKIQQVIEKKEVIQEKVQSKNICSAQNPENYQMEIMQKLQNINVPALQPLKKNDYFQHVIKSNYLLCNFLAWFVLWLTLFK